MQSFDDLLFTMMSFSAKKLEKNNIAVWGNTSNSIKWPQKFYNYVLQLYLTSDQKKKKKKKIQKCIYFRNFHFNAKLKEKKEEKKKIYL